MLNVAEKNSGLDYWRAVTKCEVEIIEGDGAPEYFYETWYLAYASAGRPQMHPLVLAVATLLAAAAAWPWPDDDTKAKLVALGARCSAAPVCSD